MEYSVEQMKGLLDRDPAEQKRFGRLLQQYESDLLEIHARLVSRIDEAEALLGEDITNTVTGEVRNLLGEIKNLLNGDLSSYGAAHVKSAEKLEQAQDMIRELLKKLNVKL